MKKPSLLLTLGHNSSAILVIDDEIVCGYEEERLTMKKSDASFPKLAIREIQKHYEIPEDPNVYVSHWALDGKIPFQSKYWDEVFMVDHFPGANYYSFETAFNLFTHHGAHIRSAMVFSGSDFYSLPGTYGVVADGFGTHGEHFSVYEFVEGRPVRKASYSGFSQSLGLLYQYATAYLGMKMHNHEYKLLAYEVHAHDIVGLDIGLLNFIAYEMSSLFFNLNHDYPARSKTIENDLSSLSIVQKGFNSHFDMVLDRLNFTQADETTKRKIIAYYVQKIVEIVVLKELSNYPIRNLLLSGGVFLNVKLNNLIAKSIPGKTCIMPLAGDQGAAIGVYEYHNPNKLKWPGHLFWGKRTFEKVDEPGLEYVAQNDALVKISQELATNGFVNIVRGAMEFGPRALCNTTTLAIPIKEVASMVNYVNDRTNEMPFALVVKKNQCERMFKQTTKIYKSLEYMICTRDFRDEEEARNHIGGAHYYPFEDVYTCRPQITQDPLIVAWLQALAGPLINTSFNFHGVPIVFDTRQVVNTHREQYKRGLAKGIEVKTFIIE